MSSGLNETVTLEDRFRELEKQLANQRNNTNQGVDPEMVRLHYNIGKALAAKETKEAEERFRDARLAFGHEEPWEISAGEAL